MKEVFWKHIGIREVCAGGFATKKRHGVISPTTTGNYFFYQRKLRNHQQGFGVLMILPSNLKIPPKNMDTMRISPMAWVGISIKLQICGCNQKWRFKSFCLMLGFGPKQMMRS